MMARVSAPTPFLLSDFIALLRRHDVRISPAESLDAGRALGRIGLASRLRVKQMLGQALAKSADEKKIVAECFESYFGNPTPPPAKSAPAAPAAARAPSEDGEFLDALARAADAVRLRDAQVFTQQGLFVRAVMERLGAGGLRADAEAAEGAGRADDARALQARHEAIFQTVRAHVEQEIRLRTAPLGKRLREDTVSRMALNRIDHRDYHILQDLVRKLVQRLAARVAPPRKHARAGRLDLRQTLRHNHLSEGIPLRLFWRQRRKTRAKLLVLCDVSGSVAAWSKFLLMILHALGDLIPRTRSFVFSDTCGEVTDLFAEHDMEHAMGEAMRRYGVGSSDYGRSLAGFAAACEDTLTPQTSIVILGDARANYGDPGHKVLRRLAHRARAVFWLNPEPKGLWDTGDSAMQKLGAHCQQVFVCQNLVQLETVSEKILRSVN